MKSKIDIERIHHLTGHGASIFALERGAESGVFYSGDGNGYIVEWDLKDSDVGKAVARVPSNVFSLKLLKEQKILAAGSMQGVLYFIDLETKKVLEPPLQLSHSIFDIQQYGGELWLATASGSLEVVELKTRKLLKRYTISDKSLRSIDLHPSFPHLVIGCSDHQIYIFDLDAREIKNNCSLHQNSVFTVQFIEKGKRLVAGSRDAHLSAWSSSDFSKNEAYIPAHLFTINDIAVSPDQSIIATASRDKSLKLWDAQSLELLKVIDSSKGEAHTNSVNKLLWLEYESYLISAGDDRSIMVWKMTPSK